MTTVPTRMWNHWSGKSGKEGSVIIRQPKNVGSLRNFETCLNRATGHYVHLLHGDDQIKNGFYREIEYLFNSFPEAGAAFTGFIFVDEETQPLYENRDLLTEPGILKNWLLEIAQSTAYTATGHGGKKISI